MKSNLNPFLTILNEISLQTQKYKITIKINSGDDGLIPHFHVTNNESKNSKKYIDCCICFDKPKYFLHGTHNKPIYDKKILQVVIDSLNTKRKNTDKTNWQFFLDEWNHSTNKRKCSVTQMPDYTKLWKEKT